MSVDGWVAGSNGCARHGSRVWYGMWCKVLKLWPGDHVVGGVGGGGSTQLIHKTLYNNFVI